MERLTYLLRKYVDGQLSPAEMQELAGEFGKPENRDVLLAFIRGTFAEPLSGEQEQQLSQRLDALDSRVLNRVSTLAESTQPSIPRPKQRNPKLLFVRIAAVLLFVFSVGLLLYRFNEDGGQLEQGVQQVADIGPGGNRAVLTLASGERIDLSDAHTGIVVEDKQITYDDRSFELVNLNAKPTDELTLATPRGGTYRITLPDGTDVWLNAASSLRYPARFAGGIRRVELQGEAFFDVATDPDTPFVVIADGQEVSVLGTRFNINAYTDGQDVSTTLVTGSVKVKDSQSGRSVLLRPGQQATRSGEGLVAKKVDVSYYTAWMSDRFVFNREPLAAIFKQVERWYDVDFVNLPEAQDIRFWGTLSRGAMLSELLNTLEMNTGLKFKREGRRIMISQ